jgi:hypothetical protein
VIQMMSATISRMPTIVQMRFLFMLFYPAARGTVDGLRTSVTASAASCVTLAGSGESGNVRIRVRPGRVRNTVKPDAVSRRSTILRAGRDDRRPHPRQGAGRGVRDDGGETRPTSACRPPPCDGQCLRCVPWPKTGDDNWLLEMGPDLTRTRWRDALDRKHNS